MQQIFSAVVDMMAGGVVFLPLMVILNQIRFRSWKKTAVYSLFGLYLLAMGGLVGLPSIYYIRFGANLNLIPFAGMMQDLKNCLLNVALFVPLGIFLRCLWRLNIKAAAKEGFFITLTIEILQIFTFRACDVNDLIANTLGTLLGFLMAKALVKLFPRLAARSWNAGDRFVIYGAVFAVMMLAQPVISNFIWMKIL